MQRLQRCEVHQRSGGSALPPRSGGSALPPRRLRPPPWASFSSVGGGRRAAPSVPGRPHPLNSSRLPVSCELALRWREGLGGPFPGGTSRDAGVRWEVWGLGYLSPGDLDLLGPQVGLAAPSTVPQPTPVWKMWVARDLQSPKLNLSLLGHGCGHEGGGIRGPGGPWPSRLLEAPSCGVLPVASCA